MNLKLLHLSSGMEVLGELISTDLENKIYHVKKPLMIGMTQEGNLGVGPFCPYMKDATNDVGVAFHNPIYIGTPIDDLVDAYKEETGGIIAPTKQIVTG